jgi:outer membrane receptor protein involved in Fe transport
VINLEDNYAIEILANRGRGQNYGLEFTLDRYWNDQFYLLSTLSLYQSTYKPSDGIWRDTRYNSNTSFTFLLGKEWTFKTKRPSSLGLDLKLISGGGVRVTPIDLPKSILQKTTVLVPSRIYGEKMKSIFRLDVQMEWKLQYTKMTGSFILGVQNALNTKNRISQRFDAATGRIAYSYLLGRIPVFGFRFDL